MTGLIIAVSAVDAVARLRPEPRSGSGGCISILLSTVIVSLIAFFILLSSDFLFFFFVNVKISFEKEERNQWTASKNT